jgi:queuine tRNA-ribosyltransferase
MLAALGVTAPELPTDQVRYLMGVGDPLGMVEAIARGVDLFDCVLPTRLGRHGTILTDAGRLNLRNAAYARDPGPLDQACPCAVCARWSRSYLRHLLRVDEPTAPRLLTTHNLAWTFGLIGRARAAIVTGTLDRLRNEVADAWA